MLTQVQNEIIKIKEESQAHMLWKLHIGMLEVATLIN